MKIRWCWAPLLATSFHVCDALVARRSASSRQDQPDQDMGWEQQVGGLHEDNGYSSRAQDQALATRDMVGIATTLADGREVEMPRGRGRDRDRGGAEDMLSSVFGRNPLSDYHSEYGADEYDRLERLKSGFEDRTQAVTADGSKEAETLRIGWLVPPAQLKPPEIRCPELCSVNSYCWQGTCVYRPWQYSQEPRKSCYADPNQPGLSDYDKEACRMGDALMNQESCESSARYCRWLHDAPAWYRQVVNDQEAAEAAERRREQEALHANTDHGEVVRDILHNLMPGNPVVGSILSNPDRKYFTDRGTR